MPNRPLRPCSEPGCSELTRDRYCERHQRSALEYDRHRGNSAQRGYDSRWRKARLAYLRAHPLCAECQRQGRLTPATVVDHIKPHKGDKALFWDVHNWQPLCKSCHDAKTAREDGGFGNDITQAT
ncbi:HNH endonuclease [Alicyclobacillus contaminans]|uniref:HNH endonuclease n=1 Tax=Alicyclobacillus contaminans TaxID=392016 RepID=UPI00047E4466|nr:HNH endonuclease signature motif containing protein [Alicyclobacillus contaminans]GMA48648.1 HNH endonuclease [Alicyclobacillus contaminans]GMA52601.1 HNH endonuclease [Alicyclobacillus contaminans]